MTPPDLLAERIKADVEAAGFSGETFATAYAERFGEKRTSVVRSYRRATRVSHRQGSLSPDVAKRYAAILGTNPERYILARRNGISGTSELVSELRALRDDLADVQARVQALEDAQSP